MDRMSEEQRSYTMSRIKSKDTKPELIVRKFLWNNGFRYRLHKKGLPGKPDIVFSGRKKVIFVNGCFWHMHDCDHFRMPTSKVEFWEAKLLKNRERDKKNQKELTEKGWKFLVVWECELKKANIEKLFGKIKDFLLDKNN